MSSPLQNRVTPWGKIVAIPARGMFMGNRGGRFHDDAKRLLRARWRSRRWIICTLDFRDRSRDVMGPGYTELFFLDEVTALAAGHRPCFECRHADATRFAAFWPGDAHAKADDIDRILHRERLGDPVMMEAGSLPGGAMFEFEGAAYAVRGNRALKWTAGGYRGGMTIPGGRVGLLTPPSTVRTLAAGYVPVFHPSAGG